MDPVLGVTAYLEPDFPALTPLRAFKVHQQLRGPHPAVTTFQGRRRNVSRPQISRAARYLQGLVDAATEMGWSAPAKADGHAGEPGPDLVIRLPSREIRVTVRELDEHGRPGLAFTTQVEYLTRTERTTMSKGFTASGKLKVTLTQGWESRPILTQRDADGAILESQLPALVPLLVTHRSHHERYIRYL